jgi:hypothetical protein
MPHEIRHLHPSDIDTSKGRIAPTTALKYLRAAHPARFRPDPTTP